MPHTNIDRAATVMRWLAIAAAVIWLLGVITVAWTYWNTASQFSQAFPVMTNEISDDVSVARLRLTIQAVVSGTWGYAIVAVLATVGWLYAETQRAAAHPLDETAETAESGVGPNGLHE